MSTEWRQTLKQFGHRNERRLDAAGLSLLLTTAVVAAVATYFLFGQDFRGYFAAARLVLEGGNPYDYAQLSPVLLQLDGRAGNNPYYYAPWWALIFTPLAAAVPYSIARGAWLGINLVVGFGALTLAQRLLGWNARGGGRWLAYWSVLFLLGWICIRYEQSGIFLFAVLVVILWALRQNLEWLAGLALPLLLTKPNVTFLPFAILTAVFWFRGYRRALLWAGVGLIGLLLLSTLAIPGWYEPIVRGELPNGLTQVLDGPDAVSGVRINTTLVDWLRAFGLPELVAWPLWMVVALSCVGLLVWMWRRGAETIYVVALATALGFIITPYALQYDYALMALCLLWIFWKLPKALTRQWWLVLAVLVFMLSVLLWEGPISDGYWLALCTSLLMIWLGWPSARLKQG